MDSYSQAAMERAMKVQEVILRAMAKKITWWQAAEIIGISERSMRRWRERVGEARAQAWGAPQTAPAAAAARDAAAHRRQPASVVSGRALARRACYSGRCHQRDLLRPVGGGRIDGDGDGGVARGDRAAGPVLRAVQRSRQPFLADAEGGWQGGFPSGDAGGAGAARVGDSDDSRLFAAGAGPFGAQLRDLAGTVAAGAAAARDHHGGRSQSLFARALHHRVQSALSGGGGAAGHGLHSLPTARPGADLLAAL